MAEPTGTPLPHHRLLAVAVEAKCGPRTVRKFLAGGRLQPLVQERIERALRVLNIARAPGGDRGNAEPAP